MKTEVDWCTMKNKNPFVFMDVSIDGDPKERIVFELFPDSAPKTADNFRALCTGEKGIGTKTGKPLHYKGSFFHHIVRGSVAQGGDFHKRDGTSGESIYGEKFPDEAPRLKHDESGLLSMPMSYRDQLGSQFVITFKAVPHLDRKAVVFGKLVQGREVLKKIENIGDDDGRPTVTVKITNCGELSEDKKKSVKVKIAKDATSDANNHELWKNKSKKSPKYRKKKKRRRYYSSTSDSSSDVGTDTSESENETDSCESYDTSSSDPTSSSDDRNKRRKQYSRRDKSKRSKKRDKRRERKRKRQAKRSKRKSKRVSDSSSDTETSVIGGTSEDEPLNVTAKQWKAGSESPRLVEQDAKSDHRKGMEIAYFPENDGRESRIENGERQGNGVEVGTFSDRSPDRLPDEVDHPGKSRSRSPRRTPSKSVSPQRNMIQSPSVSPRRRPSRSPSITNIGPGPRSVSGRSKSVSRSPLRSNSSKSPGRSVERSPLLGRMVRGVSRSPVVARTQKRDSRSPVSDRSPSASPPRTSRKSRNGSPMRVSRSVSRSPVRPSRRSRSPVKSSRRSASRSSDRAPSQRSGGRSPARGPNRNEHRSYSRSPSPCARRAARSPPSERRRRSYSRSVSVDGSPKRIKRGRGFRDRYSYTRRYRTPSPDRSPVRSYRYRGEHERYPSHRRYSPRRYRSPPRKRTPPSYRRRRSPSVSGGPPYRSHRYCPSRSPIRNRSPVEVAKARPSPRNGRRRSDSQCMKRSRSRSSGDSSPSRRAGKGRSRSSSTSKSPGGEGLVNYKDGSPGSD